MALGLDPVRDIRDVPIDAYKAGLGEYLGAVASDSWKAGPLSAIGRTVDIATSEVAAEKSGEQLMTAQEATETGRDLGLRFDQPISRGAYDVIARSKQDQLAADTTFKRARAEAGYGTTAWLLAGGAEFLSQAVDPINVASAFIPVIGEARYASMAARMGAFRAGLLRATAEGVAGQAVLEPLIAADAHQRGEEYGMLDTLMDLGFGAGLGVVLHGATYGTGAGFRFMRDRFAVRAPGASEAATPTLRSRPEEVAVDRVDGPPPVQPVAEQMERLRPETKDAALRSAVAQLVQDKPVDIEPVLASDPSWPQIKVAIEELQAHERLQGAAAATNTATVKQAELPSLTPPADFAPTPEERLAAARMVRGWTPEAPLDRPQSLSEFVRRAGGLKAEGAEAADVLASDLGRDGKKLIGTRQADHLAQAAQEAGFRFGNDTRAGSGVDVDAFTKALVEDASGARQHFPDDAHTDAWKVQQDYFDTVRLWLRDTLGVDPRGMDPRTLVWLMRQDPHTGRLMVLLDRVDRLGPNDSLELAYRLDREAAELEHAVLRDDPAEYEPGAIEPDEMLDRDGQHDHRDTTPASLEDLEKFYADHQRDAVEPSREGERPASDGPEPGGPREGGQAPDDRPGAPGAAATEAGLRREGPARAARADEGTSADLEPISDLGSFAERQQQADLHADSEALRVRDERLEGEAREATRLLQDDLADYGHVLDDDSRVAFEAAGQVFDNEAKAIDALAACQGGAA